MQGTGAPGEVGEENRALTVPKKAPHLPPPSSDWPLVPGSCTSRQQGQARLKVDKEEHSPEKTGPQAISPPLLPPPLLCASVS